MLSTSGDIETANEAEVATILVHKPCIDEQNKYAMIRVSKDILMQAKSELLIVVVTFKCATKTIKRIPATSGHKGYSKLENMLVACLYLLIQKMSINSTTLIQT